MQLKGGSGIIGGEAKAIQTAYEEGARKSGIGKWRKKNATSRWFDSGNFLNDCVRLPETQKLLNHFFNQIETTTNLYLPRNVKLLFRLLLVNVLVFE